MSDFEKLIRTNGNMLAMILQDWNNRYEATCTKDGSIEQWKIHIERMQNLEHEIRKNAFKM